jgi:hypothetical protein
MLFAGIPNVMYYHFLISLHWLGEFKRRWFPAKERPSLLDMPLRLKPRGFFVAG